MKILITGIGGFVGRRFARRLLDDGHDVTGVDNLVAGIAPNEWRYKAQARHCTFIKADIRDFIRLEPATGFDLVIHCAAIVGGRLKIDGDPLAVATDLSIDSEVLNWIVRSKTGEKKPKLIYFSSSAVYPLGVQTKEHHIDLFEGLVHFNGPAVQLPDMTYGWVKLSGEYLCRFAAQHYGLDVAIYRPFGGYGEDQSLDYPFPSIIKRLVDGDNPVTVWGSGNQQRDFIHIEDIIDAVLGTMYRLKSGDALNLGTGMGMSFRKLAHLAADTLSKAVLIVNDADKPEGVFARVASVSKLKSLWRHPDPLQRLQQGIRQVAANLTARS